MTLLEHLEFLAPGLSAITLPERERALELSLSFRPWCLTVEQQDLAQVYYALYLLHARQRQLIEMSSGVVGSGPPGVKAMSEGDVRIEWDTSGNKTWEFNKDPSGYLAMWGELNAMCGRGAITASNWVPVRVCY